MSSIVTKPKAARQRGRSGRGAIPRAWVQLLRTHVTLTHEMDLRLRAAHGLSLTEYEVLLFLSWAPDCRMRPIDLARSLLLTQGGITRLLDRLDRAELVERQPSEEDGRVIYARLTEAGGERLGEAASTHVDDVRALFADRFSESELATLARLLGRLPGGDVGIAIPEHPVR